jgi:hypothetical protein
MSFRGWATEAKDIKQPGVWKRKPAATFAAGHFSRPVAHLPKQ